MKTKTKKRAFLAVVMALAMLISALAAVPVLACDGDNCDDAVHGHVRQGRGQSHNRVELDYDNEHRAYILWRFANDDELRAAIEVYRQAGYSIALALGDEPTPLVMNPDGEFIGVYDEILSEAQVIWAWHNFYSVSIDTDLLSVFQVGFGFSRFVQQCCMITVRRGMSQSERVWLVTTFTHLNVIGRYCFVYVVNVPFDYVLRCFPHIVTGVGWDQEEWHNAHGCPGF